LKGAARSVVGGALACDSWPMTEACHRSDASGQIVRATATAPPFGQNLRAFRPHFLR
jgi:hypothetical protein